MTATDERKLGQPELDVDKAGDNDLTLWSVTTLLKVIASEGLLYWAAAETANCAIDKQPLWREMLSSEGREATIKWLRDARFRKPKDKLSATDLGSVFHACAEQYALTGTRPSKDDISALMRHHGGPQVNIKTEGPVVWLMLDQFDGWLQRFTPSYEATEVTNYSPTWGYAGTADGFITVDGFRAIIDYKTSREPLDGQGKPKTPYPESVGLQLAAYRHAEFAAVWRPRLTEKFKRRYYLLSESERALAVPVPETDGALVFQITPEACDAFPIRADEHVYRYFLNAIELFRWVNEESRTAMRGPLVSEADK